VVVIAVTDRLHSKREIKQMIKAMDDDGDGKINFQGLDPSKFLLFSFG
jgi:Ca2+-binding EF-hand superfamily protein